MIRDLLDPQFLDRQRNYVADVLEKEARKLDNGQNAALRMSHKHGVIPSDLRAAVARLREAHADSGARDRLAFIPRDPYLAIFQAALEQSYIKAGAVAAPPPGLESADAFTAVTDLELKPEFSGEIELESTEFQEGDFGYATGYLAAEAFRLFHRKEPFNTEPPRVKIADKARVVLFGDWGSGIPRAQTVADVVKKQLAAAPDREGHAIHLGDVYYAGFNDEYTNRVLPFWPGAAGRSWSLSGNHDMYTGGRGFFKVLLGDAHFAKQAKSSWFLLENGNWQIFGLDSAWQSIDIKGSKGNFHRAQPPFVKQIREANRDKGGVILSHHQPLSSYEGDSPKMIKDLRPALDQGLARAWFWGHEHRCATYHPRDDIKLAYPCLAGHGGIPVPFEGTAAPKGVRFQWDDKIESEGEQFVTMGCVVLDFDDDAINVKFINERNEEVVPADGPHRITKA